MLRIVACSILILILMPFLASAQTFQKIIDFEDMPLGNFPTLEAPRDTGDGFYLFSHSEFAGDARYTAGVYETGLPNGRALRDTGDANFGAGLVICRYDGAPFTVTSIDAGDFEPGADSRNPEVFGSIGGYDYAGTAFTRYSAATLNAPEGSFANFPLSLNYEVCFLIGVMDLGTYDESVDNIVLEWNPPAFSETFDFDTADIPLDYPPFTFDPLGNPQNTLNSSPPNDGSAFIQNGVIHIARAGTTNATPYAEPQLSLDSFSLFGRNTLPEDFTVEFSFGGTPGNTSWWGTAIRFGDGVHYDVGYGFAPGGTFGTDFRVCAQSTNSAEHACQSTSASGSFGTAFDVLYPVTMRVQTLAAGGYQFDITITDTVTATTYQDVVTHPYPYSISNIHLVRGGNGGGDALFDNLTITTPIPPGCITAGSLAPSTPSLASAQDNYCEDWTGVSQTSENLSNALLSWVNLTNANFAGSLLIGADLNHALLTTANLLNTRLDGANLESADLTGADLSFATLTGATYDQNTVFPSGNTYGVSPSGLDSNQTPWDAGMVPAPEPGFSISLLLGVSALASAGSRRRVH